MKLGAHKASRPRTATPRWWVFALLAVIYLYAFPYFGLLKSANELPRVLTTEELVDHGHFWIDARLGKLSSRNDLSSSPNGHKYANKPPGPSILAVPAYLVCKAFGEKSLRVCTWAFRVTAVILPAILFLPFFYRLSRRFTNDERARRATLVAYALGSPAMVYALLFMSHQPSAVLAGAAFFAAVAYVHGQARRPCLAAFATGFFAASSLTMDYQAFLAAFAVGAYLLLRSAARLRALVFSALGAALPLGLLMLYQWRAFGSPWKTGYSFADDPHPRAAFGGMVGLSRTSFWNVSFLPSNGLFALAPWTILALVGFIAIWRSREARRRAGAESLVCFLIVVAYFVFLSSLDGYMSRGGWCVGPRYLTTALPFVAWLAAAGLDVAFRRLATSIAALAAVLAAVVVFVVAATTYPHWPDQMANPLFDMSFRLLRQGYGVYSVGALVGLRGFWAVLPLYVLVAGLALFLVVGRTRRQRVATALAVLVAAATLFGYGRFQRGGAYADHAFNYIAATWEPR